VGGGRHRSQDQGPPVIFHPSTHATVRCAGLGSSNQTPLLVIMRLIGWRHLVGVVALFFLLPPPVEAQSSPKRATARRVSGQPPQIDGRLDDPAWAGMAALNDFEQQRPIEGAEPSEQTNVIILYDTEALYIGARMFRARPGDILRSITRRDGSGVAEHFQLSFDTHLDRRTGYTFRVSAAGARADLHHSRDSDNDGREFQYDPVWDVVTTVDSLGWVAEIRIPFSQLRFPDADQQEWGFQLERWMPDKNENLQWVMMPAKETGYISRFGTLSGIEGVKAVRPVELLPFVALDATRAAHPDPSNPFRDPTSLRGGLDAKFGIGSNFTVDATINPDFGQVEADPAEVNLSAFETALEERRPFFTEGARMMDVKGSSSFYSRRIGGQPHLSASGDFVDQPGASRILGAAKLTGRTPSRLSIAALMALTDRVNAQAFSIDSNSREHMLVEPRAGYAVVRLQQEVGKQASTFGGIFTAMSREETGDSAVSARLSEQAFSGGMDWRIRWQDGRYAVTGFAGFSHVAGDPLAIGRIQRSSAHYFQRPDAEHLGYDPERRSLSGYSAFIRADKDSGRRILWGAEVGTRSPGYETNDIGRLQSADDIDYNADIQIRETEPGRYLRNWRLGFVTRGSFNHGGDRTGEQWSQSTSLSFLNFWSFNVTTRFALGTLDDALTRGGPLMRSASSLGQDLRLSSPSGSRTGWRVNVGWNDDALGGRRTTLGGSLTLRPEPRWELSLEPSYQVSTDPRQYVTTLADPTATATYGARYLFSYVDRVTTALKMRLNFAFSPSVTIEGYAEPFAASGQYFNIGELRAPRTSALLEYGTEGTTLTRLSDGSYDIQAGETAFTLSNRDFNVLSFRSNVVLRWEWAPGSTLFVVWQQNRRASEALSDPVHLGDLLNTTGAAGDNYFALKLSYWFPFAFSR